MKWILVVSTLLLISISFSANAQECGSTPTDGCEITQDTIFTFGSYNLPNGIEIKADNIVLDCNNSTLIGDGSNNCIRMENRSGVVIRNCNFKNNNIDKYRECFYLENIEDCEFENILIDIDLGIAVQINNGTNITFDVIEIIDDGQQIYPGLPVNVSVIKGIRSYNSSHVTIKNSVFRRYPESKPEHSNYLEYNIWTMEKSFLDIAIQMEGYNNSIFNNTFEGWRQPGKVYKDRGYNESAYSEMSTAILLRGYNHVVEGNWFNDSGHCVRLYNIAKNIIIRNNTMLNTVQTVIRFSGLGRKNNVSYNTVENNYIKGMQVAAAESILHRCSKDDQGNWCTYASYNKYINNYVEGGTYTGITIEGVHNNEIRGNHLVGNKAGTSQIELKCCSHNNIIEDNLIENGVNNSGIGLINQSNNNIIRNNVIVNNSYFGIAMSYLGGGTNNTIEKNIISDNKMGGIKIGSVYSSKIISNLVKNNTGFWLYAKPEQVSTDNSVTDNCVDGSVNQEFFGMEGNTYLNNINDCECANGMNKSCVSGKYVGYQNCTDWIWGDCIFSNPADIDCDNDVDIDDLIMVTSLLGLTNSSTGWNATRDVVEDGEIDVYDLVFVAGRFT
jgi:parallel beta-helix repeat protein